MFAELTALTGLSLTGNDGAPFAPKAVALPDDGTVPDAGGTVPLDGSGSGGAWGTNVTYGWALTTPTSGATFDDNTSPTPEVTIEALAPGTELTFTLTVTGRGGTDGITPDTDTATVTATGPPASDDATLSGLTVNDGTSDLTLDPTFASATTSYAAEVANAVTTVTLTAMTTDDGASVSAVTLSGIAIADSDFTDGITVPSLLVGDNAIVVTVTAEDTSSTQTYTVTVAREAAANSAPTASDGSVTTDEDTAHTFAEDEFNFADSDGDALASVRVVTLPTAGALALDGTAATVDQAVPAAKIGDLVFTPEANANGMGYASFTFRVSDGTDESAPAYAMTVNVTAVDDPATGGPTISGTSQVGQILTAATTDIADVDGLTSPTYGYQWIRVDDDGTSNATDIVGETSDTYTLMDADVGKQIRVKVSFTDDAGGDGELTSDAYPSNGTIEAAPNAAPLFTSSATFTAAENQTRGGDGHGDGRRQRRRRDGLHDPARRRPVDVLDRRRDRGADVQVGAELRGPDGRRRQQRLRGGGAGDQRHGRAGEDGGPDDHGDGDGRGRRGAGRAGHADGDVGLGDECDGDLGRALERGAGDHGATTTGTG